jgi:hypothetical protein
MENQREYRWYWESSSSPMERFKDEDEFKWQLYDTETSKIIEEAFLRKDKLFELMLRGDVYVMDYERGIQYSKKDPFRQRLISRKRKQNDIMRISTWTIGPAIQLEVLPLPKPEIAVSNIKLQMNSGFSDNYKLYYSSNLVGGADIPSNDHLNSTVLMTEDFKLLDNTIILESKNNVKWYYTDRVNSKWIYFRQSHLLEEAYQQRENEYTHVNFVEGGKEKWVFNLQNMTLTINGNLTLKLKRVDGTLYQWQHGVEDFEQSTKKIWQNYGHGQNDLLNGEFNKPCDTFILTFGCEEYMIDFVNMLQIAIKDKTRQRYIRKIKLENTLN